MKNLLLATFGLSLTPCPLLLAQSSPPPAATPAPAQDLRFCGEPLPTYLPTVAQRWQKTLNQRTRYTDDLLAMQRKAAVLFPLIEPILEKNAVPNDLKYLVLLENRNSTRRGPTGLWQLTAHTARKLGLRVRRHHDERYDVRKSTQAACQYLWTLYRQTGSWMLAASAYNAGDDQVASFTRQTLTEKPLLLPFARAEAQLFVYQALAYRELLTRPAQYTSWLGSKTAQALSERVNVVSPAERQILLAALETPHPETESEQVSDTPPTALPSQVAVVVGGDKTPETVQLKGVRPVEQPRPAAESVARSWPTVQTRSLTNSALTEGQLFVFEVTNPQTIDEIKLAVGDMVYAHIEVIDRASGRVYLRADRVVSAQTRETRPLRLIAVEKSHRPGVPLPLRDTLATGWQLAWEKI